jgi:hypothetical protein
MIWISCFGRPFTISLSGERQIVPVAILSGVYKLHNLLDAKRRGPRILLTATGVAGD